MHLNFGVTLANGWTHAQELSPWMPYPTNALALSQQRQQLFSQAFTELFRQIKIYMYIFMPTRRRESATSSQCLNFLPPKPSWRAGVITENSSTISWSSVAVCSRLLAPVSL